MSHIVIGSEPFFMPAGMTGCLLMDPQRVIVFKVV